MLKIWISWLTGICFKDRPLWPATFLQTYFLEKYVVVDKKMTWSAARAHCQSLGGDLAMLVSQTVQDQALAAIPSSFADNHFWIGLTDEGSEGRWRWTDGSQSAWTNWESGEPGGGSGENCAIIYHRKWYDNPCSYTRRFICQIWRWWVHHSFQSSCLMEILKCFILGSLNMIIHIRQMYIFLRYFKLVG